jgi:hypothetical protein
MKIRLLQPQKTPCFHYQEQAANGIWGKQLILKNQSQQRTQWQNMELCARTKETSLKQLV